MPRIKNCCDGAYNSIDVHFTSACDNKCAHCIDSKYTGFGLITPNVDKIVNTITSHKEKIDDILFLGGEPCLFLEELIACVTQLKKKTQLKLFVTTAIPKTCYDKKELFFKLLDLCDGVNLSVQHFNETFADKIRNTKSQYDRQSFYASLPLKHKIRINLNIVKPWLYTKEDITTCLYHYDKMGFNSIKLSEIQHGKDYFVSFEKVFNISLGSPYTKGCQTYIDTAKILPKLKTPLLLKRSCFLCEETLKANLFDGFKVVTKIIKKPKNFYGVVYSNGNIYNGWQ